MIKMIKKGGWGGLFPVLAGIFFSCASAPTPAPAPPGAPAEAVNYENAKARAIAAREQALEIKADAALKDRYAGVLGTFSEAESLEKAGSPRGIDKYLEAEKGFLELYREARALREEAQRELSRARDAIRELETEAAESDRQREQSRRKGAAL